MSDLIPTIPTPTAVPWTPDMMTPDTPSPANTQTFASPHPQMHPAPYQPAPQYQAPQAGHAQPVAPQPQPPQPHMQPAAYAPAPQPQYAQPQQHAPALQPVHHMQQSAPPQMASAAAIQSQMAAQAHIAGQPHYAPPQQPQYSQASPPPLHLAMPQQMQPAGLGQIPQTLPQAPEASKSFIANLLKRSPKPVQAEADFQQDVSSRSLFNKNFILGAVTGLVVGAFVLPMVLNVFSGSEPTQAQAQAAAQASFDQPPAASNGNTFVDNAMAADAP